MHKKIIMACMAIAAFAAFVIAPTASASPVLTHGSTSGPVVAVGSSIKGTNTGETIFTGGFNVRCTHAELKGTLTTNSGTKIAGKVPKGSALFTGTGVGGDCTSALGDVKVTVNSDLCMETVTGSDNMTVTGCGANVTFSLLITSTKTNCSYSTPSVSGTFPTHADATVTVWEQKATVETGQSLVCPHEGKLDMDFDLYTTDGTTLFVS